MCERQEIDYPALVRQIYRFENPEREGPCRSLDFDTADKLLCGLNLFDMWWGELEEYYKAVDLTWHKCECPGCEVIFQATRDKAGRLKKGKYCSEVCRGAAYRIRKGLTTRRVKHLRKGYCWKGHKLTPENTVNGSNGHAQCRMCNNARQRTYDRRRSACKHGHEYTPENTYIRPNGKRECLQCKREGRNRSYATRGAQGRFVQAA